MPFSNYRDNFEPETLAVLEVAFNAVWEVVQASGGEFDQKTTRSALADLIKRRHAYPEWVPVRQERAGVDAIRRAS
jgi:hypothetical protein